MSRNVVALAAGIIFGLGLAVSGMADPAKVQGFLDVAGAWDPSLALVMAGAFAVTLVGYRFAYAKGRPLLAEAFGAPPPGVQGPLDLRLIAGAAVFGVGWGLVGFCPGPAIASLAYSHVESFVFVIAMVAGMVGHAWLSRSVAMASKF